MIVPPVVGGRRDLRSFQLDPAAARGHRVSRVTEVPSLISIDESLRSARRRDGLNLAGAWTLPTETYDGW